jgi:hypothetical protein
LLSLFFTWLTLPHSFFILCITLPPWLLCPENISEMIFQTQWGFLPLQVPQLVVGMDVLYQSRIKLFKRSFSMLELKPG